MLTARDTTAVGQWPQARSPTASASDEPKLHNDVLYVLMDCLVMPMKGDAVKSHELETILRRCQGSTKKLMGKQETIDLVHTLHRLSQVNQSLRDQANKIFWASNKIVWQVSQPIDAPRVGTKWKYRVIGNHQMVLHTPYFNHLTALELEQGACMAFFPQFGDPNWDWLWGPPPMKGLKKLTFRFFGDYTFADLVREAYMFNQHASAFAFRRIIRSATEVTIIRHWGVDAIFSGLDRGAIKEAYAQDARVQMDMVDLPLIQGYSTTEKHKMRTIEAFDRQILRSWAGDDSNAIVETHEARGVVNDRMQSPLIKVSMTATRAENASELLDSKDAFWRLTAACLQARGQLSADDLIAWTRRIKMGAVS